MQPLLLCTYKNNLYTQAFTSAGYRCIEFPMPVTTGDMEKIKGLRDIGIAVFQAESGSIGHT